MNINILSIPDFCLLPCYSLGNTISGLAGVSWSHYSRPISGRTGQWSGFCARPEYRG